MITEFNEKGQVAEDQQHVYAKRSENEFGHKYYGLTFRGKLIDPGNKRFKKFSDARIKFTSISEEKFNGYISFLSGRENRKYLQINRMTD